MEESEIHLSVTGKCPAFSDSNLHAVVVEGTLQRWNDSEEHELWIDKYDVRMLCDKYRDFHTPEKDAALAQEEEEELDEEFAYDDLLYERYQDLLDVQECDLMDLSTPNNGSDMESNDVMTLNDPVGSTSSALSAYSYAQYTEEAEVTDPFIQPMHPFPSHIKHFPDSMKHYNIILHTAHAVRNNPQLEILLKVKQKGNPLFYFL